MTTHPHDKNPDQELQDFMASLDADFGKKAKKGKADNEIARGLNTKWHQANPPLAKGAKSTARPSPEDSSQWTPIALITHIYTQRCKTCGNTVQYTGQEHVKFRNITLWGETVKPVKDCNLFLWPEALLPDLVEEHFETVSRCPGCIAVERRAEEIWDRATQASMQLDLEIYEPQQQPRTMVHEDGRITLRPLAGFRKFEQEWPAAFNKPQLSKEELTK